MDRIGYLLLRDISNCIWIRQWSVAVKRALTDGVGGPVHDPTTIAFVLEPSMFTGRKMSLSVDCSDGPTRGRSIRDLYGVTNQPANVFVCEQLAVSRFWDLMIDAMHVADDDPFKMASS